MRALIALLLLTAHPAVAAHRPHTKDMTCAAAAGLVQSRGSALLQTGVRRYDLYLASRFQCDRTSEQAVPQFAPTLDNPKCHIGFLCEPRLRLWDQ